MDFKAGVLLLLAATLTAVSALSGPSSSPASEQLSVTKSPAQAEQTRPLGDGDDDGEVEAVLAVDSAKTVKQERASADDNYTFEYAVRDRPTGRAKQQPQQEERRRAGGVVLGSYSLLSPDGSQRTVQYSAHPVHGFTAVVRRDAGVGAALFVKSPFPTAAPAPAVVLVRPQQQQQLVFDAAAPPPQLVYQGVAASPPPPAPQLLQVVTPAPARLQTSTPSARLVAVDVQRPIEPSAEDAVVNIGGRGGASAVAPVVSAMATGGRVRLQGPHLLLSAQPLPFFTLAPASLDSARLAPAPNPSPPSSFFFFGQHHQQHQQVAGSTPSASGAPRAFFSLPLVQYGPAPTASAPASPDQASSSAVYRFPHPDPPVHFATSGQGYTSAVFTAFTNPYVSYAY